MVKYSFQNFFFLCSQVRVILTHNIKVIRIQISCRSAVRFKAFLIICMNIIRQSYLMRLLTSICRKPQKFKFNTRLMRVIKKFIKICPIIHIITGQFQLRSVITLCFCTAYCNLTVTVTRNRKSN